MTTPLKSIVNAFIPKEHRWKMDLMNQWESLMGAFAKNTSIEKIDRGCIWISVKHPAIAQELSMLQSFILERINIIIAPQAISSIVFKIKSSAPSTQKQKRRTYPNLSSQPELTPQETKLLAVIKNNDLQSSLARYFRRCKSMRSLHNEKKP